MVYQLQKKTCFVFLVSDPVVITNNMMELNITSGHDLEFYFNTDMEYSNATVTFYWQKDGYPVFERQKYRGTNTQTLTILDIQNGDEGFYTLTVVMADQNIVLRSFNASISVGKTTVTLVISS